MTDAARMAVATAFIADDPAATALVLSWSLVPRGLSPSAQLRAWAHASGVPRSRVARLAPVLIVHKICLPDAQVDPAAAKVCEHVAAETLKRLRRSK